MSKNHYFGFALSNPEMLTTREADALIKEVELMVDTMRQVGFNGKVLILGPAPRHLEDCCKQAQHYLKDAEGKKVDWKIYTDTLTEYISKAINLPENVEFIAYQTVFGSGFNAGYLKDGVHLDIDADKALVSFIFRGFERSKSAEKKAVQNRQSFSAMLSKVKIAPKEEEGDNEML